MVAALPPVFGFAFGIVLRRRLFTIKTNLIKAIDAGIPGTPQRNSKVNDSAPSYHLKQKLYLANKAEQPTFGLRSHASSF